MGRSKIINMSLRALFLEEKMKKEKEKVSKDIELVRSTYVIKRKLFNIFKAKCAEHNLKMGETIEDLVIRWIKEN